MTNLIEAAQALQALVQDRQTNRILRMSFPNDDGPEATLLANGLDALEGMSCDFQYNVEVLCDNARIALKDVQGKMVTLELVREDGSARYFNGYVFEFRLVSTDGAQATYMMLLKPWLAYLQLRKDNFLFHGKSLYDQTSEILRDYEVADWQTKVTGPDEPMTDACQYDESDYNYLHRRWEAKGWHYWYEHRKDGHTLMLADDTTLAEPIDGATPEIPWQSEAGSIEDDGIAEWTPVRRIMPAQVAFSSFDFKSPRPVTVDVPTINQQGDVLGLEVYEYTGAYGFKNRSEGDQRVRQRMEEIEARGKHFEATGNDRFIAPRRTFKLTGHFDLGVMGSEGDNEFVVVDVRHRVRNNYLQNAQSPSYYGNTLNCIRKKIPWRPGPDFNSRQPRIYGLQTAIVVGPAGEEIHTDEYGRIRVQFHWDRVGQYTETSSTWIRVASSWAGSNFGVIAVPRIGQEVLVQFLDGNPDRPLVTGCVWNQHNMPPWGLPANQTQTGILSRSSQGGGYDNANAIRFEDKRGQEQLWLHAEKDQLTEVENDEVKWVGRDRRKTIDRDETNHIKQDRTETVDRNEKITVHGWRTEEVDGDETITIHSNRTERVDHNETISIGDSRAVTIGGNKSETVMQAKAETIALAKALTVGLGYQVSVGAAMNTTVGLSQSQQVGLSKSTIVGKSYTISAGDVIELRCGQSVLRMDSSGKVTITGTEFLFDASGPVQINGKDIDLN